MKFMQRTKKLNTLVKISILSAACAFGLGGSLAEVNQPSQAAVRTPSEKEGVMYWDCVTFGSYKFSDEPEDLKWRVLSKNNDGILLLADKAVTNMSYSYNTSSLSWENSNIRSWLNNVFFNNASFPTQPIQKDGDYVFLLSSDDLRNSSYGFTTIATKKVKDSSGEEFGDWWLKDVLAGTMINTIDATGDYSAKVATSSCLVRPAILLPATTSLTPLTRINSEYEEEEVAAGDTIAHLYEFNTTDATYDKDQCLTVSEEGIVLYANGLKDKNDAFNYKTHTLCTDITGTYSYSSDNGKVKSTTGKVLVTVSQDDSMPTIEKNKFVSDDGIKAASKIASATIKDGIITITAKSQPGAVYLHVADSANPEENCASCLITVKPTPSNIYTYREAVDDYSSEAVKYTKAEIGVGESTEVYICPVYKVDNVMTKINSLDPAQELTYEATVNNEYFDITPSSGCTEKFTITAKNLKDNKKTTGKATIKCVQNGKKIDISLTAVNGVREITLGKSSENNDSLTFNNAAASEFTLTSEKTPAGDAKTTEAVSGTIDISTVISSDKSPVFAGKNYTMTDVPKITALGTIDGYNSDKLENYGSIVVEEKPNADQKKITASLSSNKKVITVKAAKGVPVNTTSYFMLYYNNTENGYAVFSVKIAAKAPETSDSGTSDPGTSDPGTSDSGTSDSGTTNP